MGGDEIVDNRKKPPPSSAPAPAPASASASQASAFAAAAAAAAAPDNGVNRNSSFAQSFYQPKNQPSQKPHQHLKSPNEESEIAKPPPRTNNKISNSGSDDDTANYFRPPRKDRRKSSSRTLLAANSPSAAQAVAASASKPPPGNKTPEPNNFAYGSASPANSMPSSHASMPPAASPAPPASVKRHDSWVMDAVSAGASVDLEGFLNDNCGFGDEEVLEQYRIMAQHEARLRVKENTGFDITEYEKRRKMSSNEGNNLNESMSALQLNKQSAKKNSRIRLPDPKLWSEHSQHHQQQLSNSNNPNSSQSSSLSAMIRPEEPPLPLPKFHTSFLYQREQLSAPELCYGVEWRSGGAGMNTTNGNGGGGLSRNEHIVRCLGCRSQLRAQLLSTLVSCPVCATISPSSSTRH